MDIYRNVIRPILFSGLDLDPEQAHQQVLRLLAGLTRARSTPWGQSFCSALQHTFGLQNPRLEQTLWNLKFTNPIGLAAGFDKNGVAAPIWKNFGFGFAELGTVTFHAQPGNPPPRLFRLVADRAVLNRMGFNNEGAAALATRLAQDLNKQNHHNSNPQNGSSQVCSGRSTPAIPLGINLGKSKIIPLEHAISDYRDSFRLLKPWGDYFVINVSSPNTPGLRSLQTREFLDPLLAALQRENLAHDCSRPLFVKVAPDLTWNELEIILELVQQHHLAGIIATNTTIERQGLKTQRLKATGLSPREETGGISGAPLRDRSTEIIRFLWQNSQGRIPIIGVGGIFTAEDAWDKITAGACLLQVYTGWIYEGPWMVRRILQGLIAKLDQMNLGQITEAIGLAATPSKW